MDPSRVDSLAKLVGSGQSRRRILKTLAGGAFASIGAAIGLGSADAAKLRSVGNSCTSNGDCASGLCVQERPGRKICHCQSAADCPAGDVCTAGNCTVCDTICQLHAACDGSACGPGTLCILTAENTSRCVIELVVANCLGCTSSSDCAGGETCVIAAEEPGPDSVFTPSTLGGCPAGTPGVCATII